LIVIQAKSEQCSKVSKTEIERLRALADRATPGPWSIGEDAREAAATLRAQPRSATTGAAVGAPVDVIIPFGRAYSDAALIAASRNAIPALLDEIERLQGALVKAFNDGFEFAVEYAEVSESDGWQRVGPYIDWGYARTKLHEELLNRAKGNQS
jgi:hypothetical protein